MVELSEPDVADISAHDGAPVIVHAALDVMVNVFDSPSAEKLREVGDTLKAGGGITSFLSHPTNNVTAIKTAILQICK